ncbi:hypothetical protein G6F62_001109 [Rhizopus arrhizus]|nr:hypothetical protein G6F23_002022 [Rhizopus arrhizus]KAG0913562.1 hypothetical protein G6F33_005053 [Rhizopus arrhizus]KAG1296346.1 hypothetical protein G6F66_003548 [Rhizopus arrhizus]KAG1357992.1 hypothetical protein G6F62_001109 [Rhizopus arrhizus]KAG1379914.1 hypothetical protein G6F61_004521 [Rhizopus arrhizus]
MKTYSILVVTSLLLKTCSAGIWSSDTNQVDPVEAEKDLPESPTSKYDYKLSFKKPYYYNDSVPFWSTGGDVLKGEEFIRLSPSIPNTSGWIWSEIKNPYEEWETEVSFRVTGTHLHGGRGLAFWYTKDREQSGPIFGSTDKWDGLSIWLDSANPVNHKASTMALLNDGTLSFTSGLDPRKYALGTCSITYRNSPNPTFLKVVMKDHLLSVYLDNNGGGKDYRMCLQKSGIKLPVGYYFGVSANSHTPADDHDILSFETRQLNPPQKLAHPKRPLEEEKKKKGEEFSGIDEEQQEKIKEAEYQMRRLRDRGGNMDEETAVTMSAIYDTQSRTLENLQLLQLQVEALGAPSPEKIITGDYDVVKLASGDNAETVGQLSHRVNEIFEETKKSTVQFEKLANEQDRQIRDLQDSIRRLQETLSTLDVSKKHLKNIHQD